MGRYHYILLTDFHRLKPSFAFCFPYPTLPVLMQPGLVAVTNNFSSSTTQQHLLLYNHSLIFYSVQLLVALHTLPAL